MPTINNSNKNKNNASTAPTSIQRGNYNRALAGPLLLVLGHAASIPIQHLLLKTNPFGVHPQPASLALVSPTFWPTTQPALPSLLTVYLGMTAALVLKQAIWAFYVSNEFMTLQFAIFGVISVILYERICAVVFSLAPINPFWRPELLYTGSVVHVFAVGMELGAELQRKTFKDDARNRGKLCTTGLWGVVRHPNFACNVVYGAAYGVAAGGWLFGMLPLGMYLGNFVGNAIPPKEKYLGGRYGKQWERYVGVVRWVLCPGVY
jgi:protein-S-isoprenylcysteine O-methyltransferase Ste14